MRIIAADDEKLALDSLVRAIREEMPEVEIQAFRKPMELLAYAKEHSCEIAFLDIKMRGMEGIELAQELKKSNPKINIIFVTGYTDYMERAFGLHASGYLLKPVTKEAIAAELVELRNPVPQGGRTLRVQTFGNFEVFADNQPIKFKYNKTKEILAYLIDQKGASVSYAELRAVLWEDKPDTKSLKSQLRNLVSDLMKTLQTVTDEAILIKQGDRLAVLPKQIDCDYYRYLAGDSETVVFSGIYMKQFGWAEDTVGYLEHRAN